MSQNVTKIEWDKRKAFAAQLIAENKLTDEEIAAQSGVTRRQLARWKIQPEFQARVQQIVKETSEALKKRSIQEKEIRLEKIENQLNRIEYLMKQRAKDLAGAPGGKSGLLCKRHKAVGKTIVEEYVFDADLLREFRELLKQTAIEVGDWMRKSEIDVRNLSDRALIELVMPMIEKTYGESDGAESKSNSNQE